MSDGEKRYENCVSWAKEKQVNGINGKDGRDGTPRGEADNQKIKKVISSHAHITYTHEVGDLNIYKVSVVRPDGVVGAIIDSVDGLERYLKLVFV